MECPVCNLIMDKSGYCNICGSSNIEVPKSESSDGGNSIELPFGIKQIGDENALQSAPASKERTSERTHSGLLFDINHTPNSEEKSDTKNSDIVENKPINLLYGIEDINSPRSD
tara:strand:- start:235 stop:576 length:342 start_codon:yes stop_codon:yes gene_type:complete